MPTILKSGSLNLLQTSGPVYACAGIALPCSMIVRKQEPPVAPMQCSGHPVACSGHPVVCSGHPVAYSGHPVVCTGHPVVSL